ncbi:fungal-specific transcription factor domain-containing protein [Mycena albidolilacea]|uniref:Fungal-specific transcription factor domain-containing protein n=1 Tax=Mycena albidolilacea TaxID=1033008 RepID=A0AAD7ADV4_9AGAR|nr:fungal-specific transcription factor domain-containing protein [Mycena albidolilacea]
MPMSPYTYPSYYSPPPHHFSSYSDPLPYAHQEISLSPQERLMSHSMQPPPSPSIPIDPALSLYPPYYHSYPPQHQQQHIPPHLSLPHSYSSPSSQGSDTIGTPPMYPSSANSNGKRPGSAVSSGTSKRARKDDDDDDPQSPTADKEEGKAKPTRGSRACTVCRRLKMKCVGAEKGPPCKRCIAGNHECIFEESNRGKRSSKKHELLTRSLRKMERTLDTVLRSIGNPSLASGMISRSPSPTMQSATTSALIAARSPSPPPPSVPSFHRNRPGSPKLHSLPDNSLNPLGLLAEASLANRRAHGSHPTQIAVRPQPGDTKVGVASDNYFKPGPISILPLRRLMIERQVQPEMLSFVTTDEVVALFNIFFEQINMHSNLLDPDFHTPSLVCSRSPFLLTTICAIASKFYDANPELHPKLTEMAKKLAFSVPARGYKSLEIVQAYLLLALYGCGAVERYEQDRTWLLLGMGIRIATDLNLHRKSALAGEDSEDGRARDYEVHNRERTWMMCFCLDRSFSAQMGKPYSIKEDFVIRNAQNWARAPVAIAADQALAAYVDLQRIISRSLDVLYSGTDTPSGLIQNCDYLLVIKTFETQVLAWRQHWNGIAAAKGDENPLSPAREYLNYISIFYFNYTMLVLNSFGLQNALERAPLDIGHFFARCHSSATACAVLVRDNLGPRGFMKYSPDSNFVQTSYAVLSLLKLIRPEFQAFLENEEQTIGLVKDVADVLENISANALHTPALYSKFLRALISQRLETPAPESKPVSRGSAPGLSTPEIPQFSNSSMPFGAGDRAGTFTLNEFQFDGEMGPVADMSTFPPTMAPIPAEDSLGSLTMDNILSNGFWDSMLVPGYNTMEGLSGGFIFGAGGSGLITPRIGQSPMHSGNNSPSRAGSQNVLTQMNINAAFRQQDGAKTDV